MTRKRLFIAVFALAVFIHLARADERGNTQVGKWSTREWNWLTEEWTGDERPYRKMKIFIDKSISQGQAPAQLAEQYKQRATNWMAPQAQFRWAYAAYEAARKVEFRNQERKLQDIADALKRASDASPPRSYEYSRLRFLALVRVLPTHRLKDIGERLIQHNPQDYEVRFFLTSVLDPGRYPDEEKPALAHALYLAKALPKKPTIHSLMGEVYWKIWIRTAKETDADKSIAEYQKFLQMAPPNHSFRKGAEAQIKFMQKTKARRAKSLSQKG